MEPIETVGGGCHPGKGWISKWNSFHCRRDIIKASWTARQPSCQLWSVGRVSLEPPRKILGPHSGRGGRMDSQGFSRERDLDIVAPIPSPDLGVCETQQCKQRQKHIRKKCSTGPSASGEHAESRAGGGRWKLDSLSDGVGWGVNGRIWNYLNERKLYLKKSPESFFPLLQCLSRDHQQPSSIPTHRFNGAAFSRSLPHTPPHRARKLTYPLITLWNKLGLFKFERRRPKGHLYTKGHRHASTRALSLRK